MFMTLREGVIMSFMQSMFRYLLAAGSVVFTSTVLLPTGVQAADDTPFFTGVWELDHDGSMRGLVMSDWLIFDDKLPGTWLYMRKGSVPGERYQFYARKLGVSGVPAAIVDVAKVDDTHMLYRLSANGQILEQGEATRLSVPNAQKSCLAVDDELEDLLGKWTVVSSPKKSISFSKTEMVIDGKAQDVTLQPLRTGQIGVLVGNAPFALFTDAGGDYAVLQILPQGTPSFTGGPIGQHVDFSQEIVVRRAKGRCDAEIASRLKLVGKKK